MIYGPFVYIERTRGTRFTTSKGHVLLAHRCRGRLAGVRLDQGLARPGSQDNHVGQNGGRGGGARRKKGEGSQLGFPFKTQLMKKTTTPTPRKINPPREGPGKRISFTLFPVQPPRLQGRRGKAGEVAGFGRKGLEPQSVASAPSPPGRKNQNY